MSYSTSNPTMAGDSFGRAESTSSDNYVPTQKELRHVVLASLIGTTIEWYDFFLYGTITGLVFDKLFFPHGDLFVSTILAYTVYAVGFVTRPVGGLLFGHFGDRIGRKPLLIITLMIMGISTFLIGLIPTYASIGVGAPLILLALRLLQGLGLGGEWGGAVLMTFEFAPREKRGIYACWPQVGLAIGLCLSTGVVALLTEVLTNDQFMAWGWRAAFMLSIVLVIIGLYIRLQIMETPSFARLMEKRQIAKVPLAEVMRDYKMNVLKGWGARMIDGVVFNIYAVFTISYVSNSLGLSREGLLLAITFSAFILIFMIPIASRLSDRIGRRKVYGLGALASSLIAFPAFALMHFSGSIWGVALAVIVPFALIYPFVYGPEAALFCELFDTRVRYTGISAVYQVSGIVSSSITPLIATVLFKVGGNTPWLIAGYIFCIGLLSAFSVLVMRRTY
jgi:MFS family permease